MIPLRFFPIVLLLLAAPVAAEPPPSTPETADRSLATELLAHLDGLPDGSRAEGQALAAELAADWRREAGSGAEAESVLAILRSDLGPRLAGRSPTERLEVLRGEVYDRRVRALNVRSFALGRAVVDGTIGKAEAKAAGEALLSELASLMPVVRSVKDEEKRRVLDRELQEVSLEAIHAVAGGAMSGRLQRYAQDERPDGTPPVH
jgi:hypothetical protein